MLSTIRARYEENPAQAKLLLGIVVIFLGLYFMPAGTVRFDGAVLEGMRLTHWYAREHVILCLLPAFVIAGAMATYISQGSVMHYLGPQAPKAVAISVASVSGTLLAVCSCTVLPLFGGIYKRGAGLGAAIAFLYSGPAINIMAIVITAKVLGAEMGIARALGAILFSMVIGLTMHVIYRKEEAVRAATGGRGFNETQREKPLPSVILFFGLMVGMLVFANWAPADSNWWTVVYDWKWNITAALAVAFGILLLRRWNWPRVALAVLAMLLITVAWIIPHNHELLFALGIGGVMLIATSREQDREWASQSWDFAKQILPLLLVGVFLAGLALGRPGHEGLIPSAWVAAAVGGDSLRSTMIASVLGALMYFSTLTEVPIVETLLGAGMGKGPALALLLAGPALSLPNMLVIRTILGTGKTLVYCVLVVAMATMTGFIYGAWW